MATHGISFCDFNTITGLLNKMLIKYDDKDTLNVYFKYLNVIGDMLLMKNMLFMKNINIHEVIIGQVLNNY